MNRIVLLLATLTTLLACQEETVVSNISGQVFDNCQTVASNAEIAFKVNPTGSFSEPLILASAVTNSSGHFHFTYELDETETGTADLIRVTNTGFVNLIENIPLQEDKNYRLYSENVSTVVVSFVGTRVFGPQDTLFYQASINGQIGFRVQPSQGTLDTFNILVPNLEETGAFTWLNYGVGSQDFNRALEASNLQDSLYQNIGLLLEGCSMEEQVGITIN
ncbi:MAG: hypothetical protein RIC95_04670 [Vicingaceae bacterium]